MKPEDLFAAIGCTEFSFLEESELTVSQSSQVLCKEETTMKQKSSRALRMLLIAAAIISILTATAFALTNARIQMNVSKFQEGEPVTEQPTGSYAAKIEFQQTGNEYFELESIYPQNIPEGYTLAYISDQAMGMQSLFYHDSEGNFAFDYNMQLGRSNRPIEIAGVAEEKDITVNGNPGVLYTTTLGEKAVAWYQPEDGIGFTMFFADKNLGTAEALTIAQSVGPGKPLTPTQISAVQEIPKKIGDYRISTLPTDFVETDFSASLLAYTEGWDSFISRYYGNKVTTDNTIVFEYFHFQLQTAEADKLLGETAEDPVFEYMKYIGISESTLIHGMPGVIQENGVFWVDREAQILFHIYAPGRPTQEMLDLADSVQRIN